MKTTEHHDTPAAETTGRPRRRLPQIRWGLALLLVGALVGSGLTAATHPVTSEAGFSLAAMARTATAAMDMCAPATGRGGTTALMPMNEGGLQMQMYPTTCTAPTWAEISKVYTMLARARAANDKYRDFATAVRDGYEPSSAAFVAGQGYHYANMAYLGGGVQGRPFDLVHPPFLVYDKVGGKLTLAGLMYYVPAQTTAQQLAAIFPASLASWHRHLNICVSGSAILHVYTAARCTQQGGFFVASTGWMVHAWLWRPNSGVFSIDM